MFDGLQIPPNVSPKSHYIKCIVEKITTKQTKKPKTESTTQKNNNNNKNQKKPKPCKTRK